MHFLLLALAFSITTLGKANVLRTKEPNNGKLGDYDNDNEVQNHVTENLIHYGGLLPGAEIRKGINCGHFDSKDTTHLVSDPDHLGSFYFCVNGVSLGPMACAQGTIFHPIYKVCSWPELPKQPGDAPHISG